ncbi:c2H2-type domain-containing protein [Trichonephila clavata]|uniref:C2H2-type domain-containing protein n=1 Tax=Trichonephila clavata TaxID=2740835 RepID=A0A8X6GBG6_TRICU|nr:c2H2-type domain-containing protein [Trichonephila clavata]
MVGWILRFLGNSKKSKALRKHGNMDAEDENCLSRRRTRPIILPAQHQLEHLRLSESDRAAVAGRLKEGVSEKKILQDIREEITVDSGRKMLIEKKDIHNIKRDFNINGYIKRHEVDAVSVKLWTQEMKNNGENCIVFFQRAGTIRE